MAKKKIRKPDNTEKKLKKGPVKFQPGDKWTGNAKGRPKGSRNKFAEEFVKDFLADWEANGRAAIKRARRTDPVSYLRVAASLLPKDFNINVSSEAELEKMLEQFDDEQLEAIFAAITAAGSSLKENTVKAKARTQSNSIH